MLPSMAVQRGHISDAAT